MGLDNHGGSSFLVEECYGYSFWLGGLECHGGSSFWIVGLEFIVRILSC